MPEPIKITADVKPIRNSILEIGRDLSKLSSKKQPISIFDAKERDFLKYELNRSLGEMNKKFSEGRKTIAKLVSEQRALEKGSKEELKQRNTVVNAYKKQLNLAKKIKEGEEQRSSAFQGPLSMREQKQQTREKRRMESGVERTSRRVEQAADRALKRREQEQDRGVRRRERIKEREAAKVLRRIERPTAGDSSKDRGMLTALKKHPIIMALSAITAGGIGLAIKGVGQYVESVPQRIRLQGLGIPETEQIRPYTQREKDLGITREQHRKETANELARVGLTERTLIERRIQSIAQGSRTAGTYGGVLQRAEFEREYGLEQNQLGNIIAALRPTLGGMEANEAQMKLQATIYASGLEDAIGPYLESMVGLLTKVNETGLIQTDSLMKVFAGLAKEGVRTPEQISNTFGTINEAMKSAAGEVNAFYQVAFARAGIGGTTIGGTRLAISSGGLFGLKQRELESRGYSDELIQRMGGYGFFGDDPEEGGLLARGRSVLDQLKRSGGIDPSRDLRTIEDPTKMFGIAQLANSIFGTTGLGGFDAALLLEKTKTQELSPEKFKLQLKDIKERATRDAITPDSKRLDIINNSIAGSTDILTKNLDSNFERLGMEVIGVRNAIVGGFIFATGKATEFVAKGKDITRDLEVSEEKAQKEREERKQKQDRFDDILKSMELNYPSSPSSYKGDMSSPDIFEKSANSLNSATTKLATKLGDFSTGIDQLISFFSKNYTNPFFTTNPKLVESDTTQNFNQR